MTKAERDERGRFLPGHTRSVGNKGGRKSREVERAYLEVFRDTIGSEDWKIAVQKQLDLAKMGDTAAFKLLAAYAMGRPVQYIEQSATVDVMAMTLEQWQTMAAKRRAAIESTQGGS